MWFKLEAQTVKRPQAFINKASPACGHFLSGEEAVLQVKN